MTQTDRAMDKKAVYATPSWSMNICGINKCYHASGDICHLLITFANSLDPDQDWHIVGPDLDPTVWHCPSVSERIFFKRKILKKDSRQQQKHEKLPSMQINSFNLLLSLRSMQVALRLRLGGYHNATVQIVWQ